MRAMLCTAVASTSLSARSRTLHTSGSSDVYTATQKADGAVVVVKRTKITCPNDMKRFDREIELLAACRHECVIELLGMIREPPTYALVLPVYGRGSLFLLLHSSGRTLSARARLSLCRDTAAGLTHLHDGGVLHRDVKSDNVLVRESGRAVLADFNASEWESRVQADIMVQPRPTGGFFKQFVVGTPGIARRDPRRRFRTGWLSAHRRAGTLPYMAPELLRSVRGAAYGRPCDIYSLGITLNEVLTQRVPYSDALTEQVQLHTILDARCDGGHTLAPWARPSAAELRFAMLSAGTTTRHSARRSPPTASGRRSACRDPAVTAAAMATVAMATVAMATVAATASLGTQARRRPPLARAIGARAVHWPRSRRWPPRAGLTVRRRGPTWPWCSAAWSACSARPAGPSLVPPSSSCGTWRVGRWAVRRAARETGRRRRPRTW